MSDDREQEPDPAPRRWRGMGQFYVKGHVRVLHFRKTTLQSVQDAFSLPSFLGFVQDTSVTDWKHSVPDPLAPTVKLLGRTGACLEQEGIQEQGMVE